MKKTLISTAIAATLALGATAANAATTTITLLDNTSSANPFPATLAVNNAAFATGMEFRVMNGGAASGFGEKSITGDQAMSWDFNMTGNTGNLTAVSGTDTLDPATNQPPIGGGHTMGGPGLFQNATFFGGAFGMAAPLGDFASNGPAVLTFDSTDNFTMLFPVLEVHWNGAINMLGGDQGGVLFTCTGAISGTGSCTAESEILASEDSAGFAGQWTQWDFGVSVSPTHSAVPVPAAVWLFGSGLLGLVGVARRKKAS